MQHEIEQFLIANEISSLSHDKSCQVQQRKTCRKLQYILLGNRWILLVIDSNSKPLIVISIFSYECC